MGLNGNFLRMGMLPRISIQTRKLKEDEEGNNKIVIETGSPTQKPSSEGLKLRQPVNLPKEDTTNSETDNKTQESTSTDFVNENIENTYWYFTNYDRITSYLGDFYSETLAKMKGPEALNKKVFNEIYNKIMNDVVNKSVESAKSGELIKYSQLAQEVKDRVIAELEACNYSSSEYLDNQREDMINDAIKDSNKLNK